jgi:hypothetical protein
MKNIVLFLFISLLLYSCDKTVYFNIPQSEKPLLNNNDKILFVENSLQNVDNFLITLKDYYEDSDKKYYHENISIKYGNLQKSIYSFLIIHGGSTAISYSKYNYPTIYPEFVTSTFFVNGKSYSSVYVIKGMPNWPDSVPSSILYSHKYGIIQFKYADNRTYELKR